MVESRLPALICAALISSILITTARDVYASSVPAISLNVTDVYSGALEDYTFGYEFRAGTDFVVTALGIYDDNGDGLSSSYEVGIWNASASLLGSVTVPAGTVATLNLGYRYEDLSVSIPISSGQDYRIGALVLGGREYVRQATGITSPWLTVTTTNLYVSGGDLGRPTQAGGSDREYMTANMLVIPEPGTGLLFAVGLAGLALRRRLAA